VHCLIGSAHVYDSSSPGAFATPEIGLPGWTNVGLAAHDPAPMSGSGSAEKTRIGPTLVLAALGVVFGDIGTSPLYAVQTIFERSALRPVPVDESSIYGVISVIFWSITLIVTVLYVRMLTRADNDGEGGLLSLLSLVQRQHLSARALKVLVTLGILGAALFFGDSMITPAISVLSSVEGLEIVDPGLKSLVVPAAVGILVALLVVQRWGTARVGKLFGPVMGVWFTAIALCGGVEIVRQPAILQALSPHWALLYFVDNPLAAFLSLGGVVLVVTGAEALYADLGHVGRRPIVLSWLGLVFPALTLNYLGQGALLLRSPASVQNPFFLLVPQWALIPMVGLATLSTVIASQAVISGAFSVTHQAARLRLVPRLRVVHTSSEERGQIYMPLVNWLLLVSVVALVIGFGSSSSLAAAYGLADIGTIAVSTLLFFSLQRAAGRWPWWRVIVVGSLFLILILSFVAANTVKIAQGGWLPVSIALVLFVVLTTWRRGQQLSDASRNRKEGKLQDFISELHADDATVKRVPGCAVFLSRGEGQTPLAMRANVQHNHALHASTVLLTLETTSSPRSQPDDRVSVSDLRHANDGISHVTARLGYLDHPSIPALLVEALDKGLEADEDDIDAASYFLSVPRLRVTRAKGMARWRKHLYLATSRLTTDPVEHLDLPRDRTIVMGEEVSF
jgi:KUP system potassium uptake protein